MKLFTNNSVASFLLPISITSLLLLAVMAIFILALNVDTSNESNTDTDPPEQHIIVLNKEPSLIGCRYTLAIRGFSYIYERRTEERVVVIGDCDLYEETDTLWIIKNYGKQG